MLSILFFVGLLVLINAKSKFEGGSMGISGIGTERRSPKSSSNSNDRLSSSTSSINNLDKIENIDENVDEDEDSHFIRFPYKIPESSIIRSSTISANSKERSIQQNCKS